LAAGGGNGKARNRTPQGGAEMPGSGFVLNPEDAQRAVTGFRDCAGDATSTLRTMGNQVDELMTKYKGAQADALRTIADELKLKINKLIGDVDNLKETVTGTVAQYGSSDEDIAQTFKTAVNAGGGGQSAIHSRLTS
jgi:uncharacterized protein YukE